MNVNNTATFVLIVCMAAIISPVPAVASYTADNDNLMSMGFPMGGGKDEVDLSLCPQGAKVIDMFLSAWSRGDFQTMYLLIDDDSKKDYSFEDARFDFRFMEYKEYRISSVRKDDSNFMFLLSSGNWKEGDKDTKKMIISGKSFKIIMPSRGSIFKESAENYL